MQDRGQFGAAFRLYVPLPERRGHFFTEKENPVESAEMQRDNASVTFLWNKLRSPEGGQLDITLRAHVALSEGGLLISTEVNNRSKFTIESLAYPILGDVSVPSGEKTLSEGTWGYAGMNKKSAFSQFPQPSWVLGY